MRRTALMGIAIAAMAVGQARAGVSADDIKKNIARLPQFKQFALTLSVPDVLNELMAVAEYFFFERGDLVQGVSKLLGVDLATASSLTLSDRDDVVVRGGKIIPASFKGSREYKGVRVHGEFEADGAPSHGRFAAEWDGAALVVTSYDRMKEAIEGMGTGKAALSRPEVADFFQRALAQAPGHINILLGPKLFRKLAKELGERPSGGVANATFADGKVRADWKLFVSDDAAAKLTPMLEALTTNLASTVLGDAFDGLIGTVGSAEALWLQVARGPIRRVMGLVKDLKISSESRAVAVSVTMSRREFHTLFSVGIGAAMFLMTSRVFDPPRKSKSLQSPPRPSPAPAPDRGTGPSPDVVTPSTNDPKDKP